MDTLLFTDQPNIEIYVDLAIRDVVSVLDRMSNNIDDTLDWQEERLEAKTLMKTCAKVWRNNSGSSRTASDYEVHT